MSRRLLVGRSFETGWKGIAELQIMEHIIQFINIGVFVSTPMTSKWDLLAKPLGFHSDYVQLKSV